MKRILVVLPFITVVLVSGCSPSSTEIPFDDSSSLATDTLIVLPTNEATQEPDSPLIITKITPTSPIAPDNEELETQDPAGPTPTPSPTVTTEEELTFLETALGIIPADASEFLFTNWSEIKLYYRVPHLTSDASKEEKYWFLDRALDDNQIAVMFGQESFIWQAEDWGWDYSDLLWEASGNFERLIEEIFVQQLRSNFDFENLTNNLPTKGYSTSVYQGFDIYSVPIETVTDWQNSNPLAFRTIAILQDEGLLIMSPDIESVWRAIDALNGNETALGDNPLIKRGVFKLIGMFSVRIDLGAETCTKFGEGIDEDISGQGRIGEAIREQLEKWPVNPYELLAAGHFFVEETQQDIVLMYYDDYRTAEADFENRKDLFKYGISPKKTGFHYAGQFILDDAELDDALMTFRLNPSVDIGERPGWSQTIIGWIKAQDALFAACLVEEESGPKDLE